MISRIVLKEVKRISQELAGVSVKDFPKRVELAATALGLIAPNQGVAPETRESSCWQ